MKTLGLVVLALMIIVTSAFAMGERLKVSGGGAAVGNPAIDFTLADIFGTDKTLSDYKGKVVFLNFWATWCGPCRKEMPHMQSLYESMFGEDFEMLAVSIDHKTKAEVSQFISQKGYTFPILVDPKSKVATQYGVSGIPATFIIDKKGIIVDRVVGYRNWGAHEVVTKLKKLAK